MCLKTFNAEIARIPTIFKPLFEKHERAVRLKINKVNVKNGELLHENSHLNNKSGHFRGQLVGFRLKLLILGFDGHLLEFAHPATLFRWNQ